MALKLICGWCKRVLREGRLPISHGICETCRTRVLEMGE
jgi:hypothetical protein